MAESVPGNYNKFVVIAEDNWKLYGEEVTKTCGHVRGPGYFQNYDFPTFGARPPRQNVGRARVATRCTQNSTTKFTVSFAGYEWECTFTDRKTITLKCNAKVDLELLLFDDKHNALEGFPIRVNADCWSHTCGTAGNRQCVIMTIRVLKDRSYLPDFTSANVQIGHLKSNCRLWVGGQVFHVYKEMLCMYSPVFDRMFNGNFQEANKDDVKLDTETADPALFHDFLLFMTYPGSNYQVLPNRKNVAGLLQLAVFYQVSQLQWECEHFLEICHEMPILERIRATKKTGLKELQKRLLAKSNFNTVKAWEEFFLDYIDNE